MQNVNRYMKLGPSLQSWKIRIKFEILPMAGFRPNSKIIGNFRKIENFYDHFIKRHK